jgi:hypothetical protein
MHQLVHGWCIVKSFMMYIGLNLSSEFNVNCILFNTSSGKAMGEYESGSSHWINPIVFHSRFHPWSLVFEILFVLYSMGLNLLDLLTGNYGLRGWCISTKHSIFQFTNATPNPSYGWCRLLAQWHLFISKGFLNFLPTLQFKCFYPNLKSLFNMSYLI